MLRGAGRGGFRRALRRGFVVRVWRVVGEVLVKLVLVLVFARYLASDWVRIGPLARRDPGGNGSVYV